MAGILGGGAKPSTKPSYTGLQLQTSANGLAIPIIYGQVKIAPNLIWYGDFLAIKHKDSQGGKGGDASSTSYTYQAAVILALCEGPIVGIPQVWADKTLTTPAALNMSVYTGAPGQEPWGYLSSHHPDQALAYPSTAYVAAAPYDLGTSAGLPNHNMEVQGALWRSSFGSAYDADPALMVLDFLTNPQYGLGFPAENIDLVSLQTGPASYQAYCQAVGLYLSAALVNQEAARDTLARWLHLTNSAAFWSGDTLKIVPYGDTVVAANNHTFTPDVTPVYDLDDDDYVSDGSSDPVLVTRKDPADCKNWIKLEIFDRSNAYATDPIEAKDQAQIDLNGPLAADQVTAHEICDPAVGARAAQLMLQRSVYVRNTYKFVLGWEYCLLEPMDIVTLSDARLGMAKLPVRITSIEEDDQGSLTIEAEEFPAGIATATEYPKQQRSAYTTNYDIAPGPVNTPVIFEPASDLAMGPPQVWVAVSGGVNWGGCAVHLSLDGNTYSRIGEIDQPARLGLVTAAIGAVADPDETSTLSVSLIETPGATLGSGTEADADAARTLVYVGGELMAYETAALTGLGRYDLSYLRRGLYGTAIAAHGIGDAFARLDGNLFKYELPAEYVGQTIYLKFTSFNIYDAAEEDISTVAAYDYIPTGKGGQIAPPTELLLTSTNRIAADGTAISTLIAVWTASIGPLLAGYELQYRIHTADGSNEWVTVRLGAEAASWTLAPAIEGAVYDLQVRAVSGLSPPTYSTWTIPEGSSAVARDTTVLPAPLGVTVSTDQFQQTTTRWLLPNPLTVNPALIKRTEVWRLTGISTSHDPIAAGAVLVAEDAPLPFVDPNLPSIQTFTYWVRWVSLSAIYGDWSLPGVGATSYLVPIEAFGRAAIDQSLLVPALVQAISSIPNLVDAILQATGHAAQALASVNVETTARQTADQAFAEQITTVETSFADSVALVRQDIQAVSDAAGATASDVLDLQAYFAGSFAFVQDNYTVIANGQQQLSQHVTNLQSQANGSTASVQEIQQSIGGITAEDTIKTELDVNGVKYVAGMGIITTETDKGPTSEIAFLSDKFLIAHLQPDGSVAKGAPFFIGPDPTYTGGGTAPTVILLGGDGSTVYAGKITLNQLVSDSITTNLITVRSALDGTGGLVVIDKDGNTVLDPTHGIYPGASTSAVTATGSAHLTGSDIVTPATGTATFAGRLAFIVVNWSSTYSAADGGKNDGMTITLLVNGVSTFFTSGLTGVQDSFICPYRGQGTFTVEVQFALRDTFDVVDITAEIDVIDFKA